MQNNFLDFSEFARMCMHVDFSFWNECTKDLDETSESTRAIYSIIFLTLSFILFLFVPDNIQHSKQHLL